MSDTSAAGTRAVAGAFTALSTITVGLRFYARKKQNVPLLADDWCMLGGLIAFLVCTSCVFVLTSGHLVANIKWIGYTILPFSPQQLPAVYEKSFKIILVSDIMTVLCLTLTKMSALLLYKRIFVVHAPTRRHGIFNIIIIATLVLVVCWAITFEFWGIFQCRGHFSDLYVPAVYNKYCTYSLPYLYGLYVSDFLLDIWILVLPIPKIIRLHMAPEKKIGIIGVFMLAFVGIGAAIARLVNFLRIVILKYDSFEKTKPEDPVTLFIFFAILEMGMAIIAINLPTLWSIFARIGPELIIKMARSVTSLTSRNSDDRESQHSSIHQLAGSRPTAGSVDVTGQAANEAYAMYDMDAVPVSNLPRSQIVVNDSIQISSAQKDSHKV